MFSIIVRNGYYGFNQKICQFLKWEINVSSHIIRNTFTLMLAKTIFVRCMRNCYMFKIDANDAHHDKKAEE